MVITELMKAAKEGKDLNPYLNQIKKQDQNGYTALMYAITSGTEDGVKTLAPLEKNIPMQSGWTSLMLSVALNKPKYISYLLDEAGRRNSLGDTALIIAAKNGNYKCITNELLVLEKGITNHTKKTALMISAKNGTVNCLKALIPLEAGIIKEDTKLPALYFAALAGNVEAVKLLLPYEGKIIGKDNYNPLYAAAEKGHTECVKLLIDNYQKLQVEPYKWTALMTAAYNGHKDCISYLMNKESGMVTKDGMTATMLSVIQNKQDIASTLINLENGMTDKNGKTALIHAIIKNRPLTLIRNLLCEAGYANRLDHNKTALMYAIDMTNINVCRLLIEKEYEIVNDKQQTAIEYAISLKDYHTAELLGKENYKCSICGVIVKCKDYRHHKSSHNEIKPILIKPFDPNNVKPLVNENLITCVCGDTYTEKNKKAHFAESDAHKLVRCQFCKKNYQKWENHPANGLCPKLKLCQSCRRPLLNTEEAHFKEVMCEICKTTIKECILERHIDGHKIIKCKCGGEYEKKDESTHRLTIPHRKIQCSCGQEMENFEYDEHIKSNHGKIPTLGPIPQAPIFVQTAYTPINDIVENEGKKE